MVSTLFPFWGITGLSGGKKLGPFTEFLRLLRVSMWSEPPRVPVSWMVVVVPENS